MSQSFAVFDIDGTLIRWQLYHAVFEALAKLGSIDDATHQTVRDARMLWKRRAGEESFRAYEQRLVTAYESLLSHITVQEFQTAAGAVFEEYKDQVYTYTRDLIRELKRRGYLLFAISGSQQEIVERVANYYGFDDCAGAVYEQKAGRFTGRSTFRPGTKHLTLQSLIAKHHARLTGSVAVGDSESDISLLEMVEQPIAFNPTKKLFDQAKSQGWPVVIERKNVIYKLEVKDGDYTLT